MENKANYVRAREWTQTITMLKGTDLTLVAKLEYESGIDVEEVADGLKLFCDDGGCMLHCAFYAYGNLHHNEFVLNPAGDRFRMLNGWHEFNEHSKSRLLRYVMVNAMRSAPREKVKEQQQRHLREEVERTKANVKKHGFFQDAFEAILNAERERFKK